MRLIFIFAALSSARCIYALLNHSLFLTPEQPLNLSLSDVDARFRIKARVTVESINSVSAAVNVLDYIRRLSEGPFTSVITSPEAYSTNPWTDVQIALMPRSMRASRFQRRFAIWGLYLSLCYMNAEDFQSTIFSVFWEDQGVGVIVVGRPETINSAKFMNILNNGSDHAIQQFSHGNPSEASENEIQVDIRKVPGGAAFSLAQAQAVLAKQMVDVAERNKGDRTPDKYTAKQGYAEYLITSNQYPLRGPPFVFTNLRFIEAAWKVAQWLARQNTYGEYLADVKVAGSSIGSLRGTSATVPPAGTS